MNQEKLLELKDLILFQVSGKNRVLLTEEIELPEKIKKSKNKNYGYTNFYEATKLKELSESFQHSSKTKRVFLINWVNRAVNVGKIKMTENSKGKNILNGEYISFVDLHEILDKLLEDKTVFQDFPELFSTFLTSSSQILLNEGKANKENSKYISLKEKGKSSFERKVELYFAKYAFSMEYGKYINVEEFTYFLNQYFEKKVALANAEKLLPSVVVRAKVEDFSFVKKLKETHIEKFKPRKNSFLFEKKLLPSVVVKNLNPACTFYFGVADKIRSSKVLEMQDKKKKAKKKWNVMPIVLASALSLLSGASYQKPYTEEKEIITTIENASYEVDKMKTEPVYESRDAQVKRLLSTYKIGEEIHVPKGVLSYASSDHNYGGNNRSGIIAEDSSFALERVVILENGSIVKNEDAKGKSILECLDGNLSCNVEVVLHINKGWIDFKDIFHIPNERVQVGAKDVIEQTLSGEVKDCKGEILLEEENLLLTRDIQEGQIIENGDSFYQINQLEFVEEQKSEMSYTEYEGAFDFSLQNISKKKALLLESLGLLSTLLLNRESSKKRKSRRR